MSPRQPRYPTRLRSGIPRRMQDVWQRIDKLLQARTAKPARQWTKAHLEKEQAMERGLSAEQREGNRKADEEAKAAAYEAAPSCRVPPPARRRGF